jgi:hypothetical protein
VSGGLYFNLEVNGRGLKTLTDDIDIYNGVKMLSGILTAGAYRFKLSPLANLTETDASYVLGRVGVRRTPVTGVLEDFGGVGLLLTPALGSGPARSQAGKPHHGRSTNGCGRQPGHSVVFRHLGAGQRGSEI